MNFEEPKIENEDGPVEPEIVFDESREVEGFPEGEPGEVRKGYSFFARVEKEGEVGWEFITSDMVNEPVLNAVSEDQKNSWSKREIIAVPADFIWSEEKGLWQVGS